MEIFNPNPPAPIPPKTPGISQKPTSFAAIEEKLDAILEYQKKAAHRALFKAIISFIFFLVFIVLPVIGGFYLYDYMKNSGIDLQKITEQYKGLTDTVGKLKETTEQIGDIKNTVDSTLQKVPSLPKL
jgi:hypothetical protein